MKIMIRSCQVVGYTQRTDLVQFLYEKLESIVGNKSAMDLGVKTVLKIY